MIETVNPATGRAANHYNEDSGPAVESTLDRAHEMFGEWRTTGTSLRADLLRRLAGVLRERRDGLALLMANEMGKPVSQGGAEADKCAWVCEYYADNAERYLAPEPVETDASESYVSYQPLGAVLAVMPWNFPFWQVLRFAAPSLMAGNVALLKHASNVPGCTLEIADCFKAAGFPDGVFGTLLVRSSRVEQIIAHPKVAAVTLTGSVEAGRRVARAAGQHLKKCVLELGGSDPYVILEDADLEAAAAICVKSRLLNSGQSCIAAKRFVVPRPLVKPFAELMVERMQAAAVGDPLSLETEVGPMARSDLRDDLHHQVAQSLDQGARLLCGGRIPDKGGAWYPPTVLAEVQPGMPAHDEETFGPVAAIIAARDDEDAIRIANSSSFGLGAAVFTADVQRGREIAERQLQAGACFVNSHVRSDPRLPFGGIKDSGYGRELGRHGIREFVNIKTVYVG